MTDLEGKAAADQLLRAGRYQEASLAFLELLRKTPDNPDVLDGAGRSLLGMGSPGRAIPFFEREIALRPLVQETYRYLSEALLASGRFGEAHKLLTRLTSADPSDGASWVQLGLLSYRSGYYPAAIEAFNRALGTGLNMVASAQRNQIEVLRAISFVQAGLSEQAGKVIPELLTRPENSANLDLLLSDVRLLYEIGRLEEALMQSDRALKAAPTNGAVHLWRARLFLESDKIAEALFEAERSRELEPTSPAPRGLLVRLYRRSGRAEDADREADWLREHEAEDGRAQR